MKPSATNTHRITMMNQFIPTSTQPARTNPAGIIASVFCLILRIILVIIGLLIAIPVIVILLVLGLLIFAYIRIRMLFTRAHKPNGPLDGRHNVRVIDRDD
ncbi:MAG: hypothetical protein JKY96_07165 [Phycisphaerales bacterium]|nr:hypothetical protein [Phycisphaerales bacterium]